ncbi:uncharacterized protein LOC130768299 [Actinidia eriantha]|uniref:uncharacterized protein LOC130768299 n=1 Tax=Actinidia eriantha TaxID=165200 RepID=UPI0025867F42|nr:uncharacterized protein LOC130768299 [Actinidia eriantha]
MSRGGLYTAEEEDSRPPSSFSEPVSCHAKRTTRTRHNKQTPSKKNKIPTGPFLSWVLVKTAQVGIEEFSHGEDWRKLLVECSDKGFQVRSPTKDNEKRSSRRTEENEKEEEEKKRGKMRFFSRKSLFQETTIQHNEAKDLIASSANSSVTTTLPTNSVAETADIPGMEKVSKINYEHVCQRYYRPSVTIIAYRPPGIHGIGPAKRDFKTYHP